MAIRNTRRVLNAAVIGCSGIGILHANSYPMCKNVRLVAVADLDRSFADRVASENRVKALYSVEEALADPDIDIIDIAAPTRFHADIAVRAAKHEKHCICEKPVALNAGEHQRMTEAFKASGTVIGGIFQHRFSAQAIELARRIRSGEFGENPNGSSVTNWWRDAAYWLVPGRGSYATAGGGVLMVHAIHAIDLIVNLLGEPVSVSASIDNTGQPEGVEVENMGTASIIFKSGAIANIMASTRIWNPTYPVPGQKMDHMALVETHDIAVTGDKDSWMFETPPQPLKELFAGNLDDVAESILTGREPIVSLDSAWQTIRLIQEMYKSATNGGTRTDI